MKSSIDPSLGSAAHLALRVSERDARASRVSEERDEHGAELFAQAVTELLVRRLPPLPRGGGEPPPPARHGAAAPPAGSGELAGAERPAGAGQAASAGAPGARPDGADTPGELRAEVSDERFGRLQLVVARGGAGLDIVINVADSRVKALIEADHAALIKTLKDAGLRVASVQIGSSAQPGTGLALDRAGAERPRAGAALSTPNARRRAYPPSREEEDDPSSEGVDFTA